MTETNEDLVKKWGKLLKSNNNSKAMLIEPFSPYDESRKMKQHIDELLEVVNDAFEVSLFVKNNEYPSEQSENFFKFTNLLHKLECSLREAGFENRSK
jgi:hypothetical protein